MSLTRKVLALALATVSSLLPAGVVVAQEAGGGVVVKGGTAAPAAAGVPGGLGAQVGSPSLPPQLTPAAPAAATPTPAPVAGVGPGTTPAGAAQPSQPGASQAGTPAADGQRTVQGDASKPADTSNGFKTEPLRKVRADETEFQRYVRQTTGRSLNLFGFELFDGAPFTAAQGASVSASYILGPGDDLVVQTYGLLDMNQRFVIDREGRVMVPKVGPLTLAGVPFGEVEKVFTAHLARAYRNFSLSITMGRVRSIEVFVLGQASSPGKHVVSGLSTLINGLFETGGPSANGSLRAVELRRAGKTVTRVDLYLFLAKGEAASDVRLLPGDVIFIPPAGPRAAVTGSVNAPAIYELKPGETIHNVLDLTGGLPVLAAPQKAQLERVNPANQVARYVEDFALDDKGLARPLQAGDVLTVFQISPQIGDVVTLQGNVSAPMRYTWRKGMRVSDVLTDTQLLIPGSYWLEQNVGAASGTPSRPEVNLDYATLQRLDPATLRTRIIPFNPRKAIAKDDSEDLVLVSGDILTIYKPGDAGPDTNDSVTVRGELVGGTQRFVWRSGFRVKDIIPSGQWLVDYYNYWQRGSGESLRDDINWDYAQVLRRVPETLQTRTFNFSLGGAVLTGRVEDNLELKPGDQITLFTTREVPVPLEKRIRLVTVDGEVRVPGIYQVQPDETLPQLIERAGGVTTQAYIFGTEFAREETRKQQQAALNEAIRRLEAQLISEAATKVANITSEQQGQSLAAQNEIRKAQFARLKSLQSGGRIALDLPVTASTPSDLPALTLEDGDRVKVPARPAFVYAVGAVANSNALLWRPGRKAADYLDSAGVDRYAEMSNSFVLRADGTVVHNNRRSWLSSLESLELMPGDTLVVPEKSDRETVWTALTRGLRDWSQIFYQFGLAAAAIRTLSN